jgi:hypothetical protein
MFDAFGFVLSVGLELSQRRCCPEVEVCVKFTETLKAIVAIRGFLYILHFSERT